MFHSNFEMDLKESIQLLRDFLASSANKLNQQVKLSDLSLINLLQANLNAFKEKHAQFYESITSNTRNLVDERDTYWTFALVALSLLKNLNESNFVPNQNDCYLSVNDELLLKSYIQFVVCFGIHYNLEENVGISIDKLSKFGANVMLKRANVDNSLRNKRLNVTLSYLWSMKMNRREHFVSIVETYFYRSHLHDLICSLIQVCHSANSGLSVESESFAKYHKWLNVDLFEELNGASIVSSLLMAQSNVKSLSREVQLAVGWFVKSIGDLLTKCLMRPNSVMNVIKAVLNEINAVSDVTLASDWKKCDLVAKILAQCPRQMSIDDYIKFLAPQLLNLFFESDARYAKHFYRVGGTIYSLYATKWPELTREHLSSKILYPFYEYMNNSKEMTFELNCDDIEKLLNKMDIVYLISVEPNWATLNQIPIELMHLIFVVYSMLLKKKLNDSKLESLKIKCSDLLQIYLSMMPNQTNHDLSIKLLTDLLTINQHKSNRRCVIHVKANQFEMEDENFIELRCSNLEHESQAFIFAKSIPADKLINKGLSQLLKSIKNKDLNMDLLLHLFEKILKLSSDRSIKKLNSLNDRTLIDLEERLSNEEAYSNLKAKYFMLLSDLFEIIDLQIMIDESDKVLTFCKLILDNLIKVIQNSGGELEYNVHKEDIEPDATAQLIQSEYESVNLILTIVSMFTTGLVEINGDLKKKLQDFLPLLFEIKDIYVDTDLESLSQSLYATIATYGLPKDEYSKATTNNYNDNKKKKPLIEVLSEEERHDSNNNQQQQNETKYERTESYENALMHLNDPMVPVKAHGLVMLRRLVEKRDSKCLENREQVLATFLKHLKHDDSYIYLAAINGLISLTAFSDPNEQVLDTLVESFLTSQATNGKLDVENKLKIGESLTKTIKSYNELVPKYTPKLLNMFLNGCRSEDELIRSSSLSNLGEMCKLMKYSLQFSIYEILDCLSCLIETDKSIQVKRSAIMVLKMIVEGLRNENFVQILGDSIAKLYKLLSKTRLCVNDEIVQMHCQLTLDYFNELMRSSMFPKQKLEKSINILP